MKLPNTTASQSLVSSMINATPSLISLEIEVPGKISVQGCADYNKSDLVKISNNPACINLPSPRNGLCTSTHDDQKINCGGTATCEKRVDCLSNRQDIQGYYRATISELNDCKKNSWKNDKGMKTAASNAITALEAGINGHQRAIDLVADWVGQNC